MSEPWKKATRIKTLKNARPRDVLLYIVKGADPELLNEIQVRLTEKGYENAIVANFDMDIYRLSQVELEALGDRIRELLRPAPKNRSKVTKMKLAMGKL